MTFSPNERTTVDDPANRPGRRLRRLTRGRPRQITTATAAVTLLSALFFAAPATSSPTPAEAAAAVTQRLLPPKAGPDAKQKCEGPRLVKLKETDAPNYQNTTVPDLIAKNPRATFSFEKGTYRLPTLKPTEGQTFIGTPEVKLTGAVVLGAAGGTKWHADAATGTWYVTDQNRNPDGSFNWDGPCLTDHPMCKQPEELFFDDAVQRPAQVRA